VDAVECGVEGEFLCTFLAAASVKAIISGKGVAVLSWLGKGGGLLVIGLWNLPQARTLSG
jgi:hypothetical protein